MQSDKQESERQMRLMMDAVMKARCEEIKESMRMSATDLQTKYEELLKEYTALSVQMKNEHAKYSNGSTALRMRIGELLNYIWLQNEKKTQMETIQNKLMSDVKMKQEEMKKMNNELKEK